MGTATVSQKKPRAQTQEELMRRDGFVPAHDAREACSVKHLGTIHRMIEDARIEGVRVGRFWFVKLSSLRDYYRNEEVQPIVDQIEAWARAHSVPLR